MQAGSAGASVSVTCGLPRSARLCEPAGFRAALASRPAGKTRHFAMYLLDRRHSAGQADARPVTDAAGMPAAGARLGLVVARRAARRAVERNLIKRQARELFRQCRRQLPDCDLVLRLARGFDPAEYGSRTALRAACRAEIAQLLARACGAGSERTGG